MKLSEIPLSLYIHVPWCVKKCPYCDFNSHESSDVIPEQAFLSALSADLREEVQYAQGRPIVSIFIGGGTPSLLSANFYCQLLGVISDHLDFAEDIEITMEANPGTFEQEKFSGFRQAGINRLSIGAQSFSSAQLKSLGRIHDEHEAIRAVKSAQAVGFDNLNVDIMFGLSGQTVDHAMADLRQAIALNPQHISWYQLTIEPNTRYYNKPPSLPEDDLIWAMQVQGKQLLKEAGFINYEISAYAQNGRQASHNLNYWQFGDYLAIGPGAHGKVTHLDPFKVQRHWKTRQPVDYLNVEKPFMAGIKVIEKKDMPLEFMLNGLRLVKGFTWEQFEKRTGLILSDVEDKVELLATKGLLDNSSGALQPTEKGHQYLNFVLEEFLG